MSCSACSNTPRDELHSLSQIEVGAALGRSCFTCRWRRQAQDADIVPSEVADFAKEHIANWEVHVLMLTTKLPPALELSWAIPSRRPARGLALPCGSLKLIDVRDRSTAARLAKLHCTLRSSTVRSLLGSTTTTAQVVASLHLLPWSMSCSTTTKHRLW